MCKAHSSEPLRHTSHGRDSGFVEIYWEEEGRYGEGRTAAVVIAERLFFLCGDRARIEVRRSFFVKL